LQKNNAFRSGSKSKVKGQGRKNSPGLRKKQPDKSPAQVKNINEDIAFQKGQMTSDDIKFKEEQKKKTDEAIKRELARQKIEKLKAELAKSKAEIEKAEKELAFWEGTYKAATAVRDTAQTALDVARSPNNPPSPSALRLDYLIIFLFPYYNISSNYILKCSYSFLLVILVRLTSVREFAYYPSY